MKSLQLLQKIRISGEIVVITGLHIGGNKNGLNIGGMDLPVIKTMQGVPYIPGSSLRGKLRSMAARVFGTQAVSDRNLPPSEVDAGHPTLFKLFGLPANDSQKTKVPVTHLVVRDAYLDMEAWKSLKARKVIDTDLLETEYTENKWENVIDRISGKANPRQIERIPAQAIFRFEMFYNSFGDQKEKEEMELLLKVMRMLEDDYLGGHGSRGSGQIKFDKVKIQAKSLADYEKSSHWDGIQENTSYKWQPEQ